MSQLPPPADRVGSVRAAKGHSLRLVALLAGICFLAHFNREGMAVAADMRIMGQYDISPTKMGVVYSAFLVLYTVMMIPGGWFIDHFGARIALAVVCLSTALFVTLTATVGLVIVSGAVAFASLLVIRGLMGMFNAPVHPATATAISLGVPVRQRSAANGLATGAALLGVACTYVVLGSMIEWIDWTWAFVVSAGATAVLGLFWIRYAGGTTGRQAASTARRAVAPAAASPHAGDAGLGSFLRRNKNLLLLTFSYAAVGYFQYLFFYWMHYYFESVLNVGSEQSRYYASIPPLAMALGMPLGGWVSDRLLTSFGWRTARAGLAMTAMAASAGLLLLGTRATDNPVWIVTWLSLALGVLGMVEGPFWVTAVEVGGNRGGLSAGIFNTGGNAGGIVAPIATPWISETLGFGWQTGIGVGSVVCLAGAVLWLWIDDVAPDRCEPGEAVTSLEPPYAVGARRQ